MKPKLQVKGYFIIIIITMHVLWAAVEFHVSPTGESIDCFAFFQEDLVKQKVHCGVVLVLGMLAHHKYQEDQDQHCFRPLETTRTRCSG